jgi:hypothetical protein
MNRRHIITKLVAPLLLVAGLLAFRAVGADAAGATVGWVQSRAIIGTDGSAFTSGTWLYSPRTGRVYMTTNAHNFKACQSCPVKPSSVTFRFEGSPSNTFNTSNVIFPTNPAKAWYDIAIVDLGPADATVADTRRAHNYCTPANCTAAFGQGSAANANWAGSAVDVAGAANAEENWGVVAHKAVSGTSVGVVKGAVHRAYDGWDWWGILVEGLSGCGLTHGDSSSSVFAGADHEALFLGVVATFGPYWWETNGNSCFSGSRAVGSGLVYVAWYDIHQAWDSLDLQPVTYL